MDNGVKIIMWRMTGADLAFFQGGGFDPTTMRSIVHEPRSGEPIFWGYFEPP